MTNEKNPKSALVPLTRIDQGTGTPYARPKAVTAEIEAMLALPLHDVFALAYSGQLRPQTLVYFMRNFRPNKKNPTYDALVIAFYSRLERSGDRLMSGLTQTQREWAQGEVVQKALEWLNDDRMDIFECSFKTGAERLFFTAVSKVRRLTRGEVAQEDLVDHDGDLTGEEAADVLGMQHAGSSLPLAEVRAELRQIEEKLTDKERLAVIYVEKMGMIEKEAARLIGCSSRNVRYLIESAQAKACGEARRTRSSARESVKR